MYVTASELAYNDVLGSSESCGENSKSIWKNNDANSLHKELRNRHILEYNDIKRLQKMFLQRKKAALMNPLFK